MLKRPTFLLVGLFIGSLRSLLELLVWTVAAPWFLLPYQADAVVPAIVGDAGFGVEWRGGRLPRPCGADQRADAAGVLPVVLEPVELRERRA